MCCHREHWLHAICLIVFILIKNECEERWWKEMWYLNISELIQVWVVFSSFDLVFVPRSNHSEYSVIWSNYGTSNKFAKLLGYWRIAVDLEVYIILGSQYIIGYYIEIYHKQKTFSTVKFTGIPWCFLYVITIFSMVKFCKLYRFFSVYHIKVYTIAVILKENYCKQVYDRSVFNIVIYHNQNSFQPWNLQFLKKAYCNILHMVIIFTMVVYCKKVYILPVIFLQQITVNRFTIYHFF